MDCDDGDPCTADVCVDGACQYQAQADCCRGMSLHAASTSPKNRTPQDGSTAQRIGRTDSSILDQERHLRPNSDSFATMNNRGPNFSDHLATDGLRLQCPQCGPGGCDDPCIQNYQIELATCDPSSIMEMFVCLGDAWLHLGECAFYSPTGCGSAPPAPPGSQPCDRYGCDEYLSASMLCFCYCMSSNPWNDQVRACLACYLDNECDAAQSHRLCYAASDSAALSGKDFDELAQCCVTCRFDIPLP